MTTDGHGAVPEGAGGRDGADGEGGGIACGPLPGGSGTRRRTGRPYEQMRTKFSRMRCPWAEDFSGWNWQPNTLPRQTAEAKLRA